MTSSKNIEFLSCFQESLPADSVSDNYPRQVMGACYSWVKPQKVSAPKLIAYSRDLVDTLGFSSEFCHSYSFTESFVGNHLLPGMKPYAMCYGRHQFGNWAGQLGDGRAINLGEYIDPQGVLHAFQLKGAGSAPYSRTADGLAVLRSSLREFLCSEAMHHLGIPTTRALSIILTGENVERDILYNGNPQMEPGAVVTRTAQSFIRFGHFEIFASRNDMANLEKLIAYTIQHNYPDLYNEFKKDKKTAILKWYAEVCERTCIMIVEWMRVGFVHGVMNTDNMSILGLTIDYGPYGWLDN